MIKMKKTDMSVWVPIIRCEEDVEFDVTIQELTDCVLGSRESALEFFENLKKQFKEEWTNFCDVSPYSVFYPEITSENCNWYSWEFTWETKEKKYSCSFTLQLTDIYN